MALARRMADRMKQRRQYKEAAQVLSQYASDPEEAIVVLLEGRAWADSLCMVSTFEISCSYHIWYCILVEVSVVFIKPYMFITSQVVMLSCLLLVI